MHNALLGAALFVVSFALAKLAKWGLVYAVLCLLGLGPNCRA